MCYPSAFTYVIKSAPCIYTGPNGYHAFTNQQELIAYALQTGPDRSSEGEYTFVHILVCVVVIYLKTNIGQQYHRIVGNPPARENYLRFLVAPPRAPCGATRLEVVAGGIRPNFCVILPDSLWQQESILFRGRQGSGQHAVMSVLLP